MKQVSAFLTMFADINIARHIDIDGIRHREVTPNDAYMVTVDTARRLVRTLETVLQGLYDDTAALLLTTQNIRELDSFQHPGDQESTYDLLDKLSMSLSSNLSSCRQTTEAILSVGHEQADLAQGDYIGSIEWRMSRLSVISTQFGGGVSNHPPGAGPFATDTYESENEGMVDLDFALRPGTKKKAPWTALGSQDSSYESGQTAVNGGSSSLLPDMSDTHSMDNTLVHDAQDDVDFQDDLFDDDRECSPSRYLLHQVVMLTFGW